MPPIRNEDMISAKTVVVVAMLTLVGAPAAQEKPDEAPAPVT